MNQISMKKLIVVLSVLAAVSGCGTSPTPLANATLADQGRVYSKSVAVTKSTATVTVIRDSGLHGAEHVFEIFANGVHSADLRQGEKISIAVDAGSVFIEARMHNVLGKVPPVQVETVLIEGGEYFYRVGLDELTLRLQRDLALSKK